MNLITFYLLNEEGLETTIDINWNFNFLPEKGQFIYENNHIYIVKGVHLETKSLKVTIAAVECKMGNYDDLDLPFQLN